MPVGPNWRPRPTASSDSERPPMTRILHIVTRPMEPAVERLVEDQERVAGQAVRVHRLDQGDPDYRRLLVEVFEADSIECW